MTTFSLFAALFACHTIVWEVHGHSLEAANKETPRLTATHSVVQMTTADGVALEMEGYPGGPSVVLLNMIPPRSLVDYADWAGQNQIPVPALLGFMTGGRSTENNLAMSEVKGFPAMFTYSTQEREGAESQRQVFAEWVFHEDKGGGHGTKMFSVRPEVSAVLLATLKTAL